MHVIYCMLTLVQNYSADDSNQSNKWLFGTVMKARFSPMRNRALIVFKASVCVIVKFVCVCVWLLIEHVADVVIVCVWMCIWHAGPSLESRARILEAVGRRWLASEHGGPFVTDGWVLDMQSRNHPLTHMWVCASLNSITRAHTHTRTFRKACKMSTYALPYIYAHENLYKESLRSLSI